MILLNAKLEYITIKEINNITASIYSDGYVHLNSKELIKGVILDTRPFDVTQYPNLKVISRIGVGIDNIDLDECKKRNIEVKTTKCYELSSAVADFTIMQLMKLMAYNNLRDSLYGKKVAIIGSGSIGYKVGWLLSKFGCSINYFDKEHISTYWNHQLDTWSMPMNELNKYLSDVDIVSVHISGTDQVIGEEEINLMKKGSYLLNMARSRCVNTPIAFNAAINKKIAGFASDFYYNDADIMDEYMLKQNNINILLTPHIASSTKAARQKMEIMAVNNLKEGLSK